jgi:hypothetical protein
MTIEEINSDRDKFLIIFQKRDSELQNWFKTDQRKRYGHQ